VPEYVVFIWCLIAATLAVLAFSLLERYSLPLRARWDVNRLIAKLRRDQERGIDVQPRLMPESQCVVRFSESAVSYTEPGGAVEAVSWDDLQRVEIVTTDQGPFLCDVYWMLHGSKTCCVVPQGATGEKELIIRLQQLPGFQHEAAIKAMASTENRRFLCWKKTDIAGETHLPRFEPTK
jgi:hypothetical protein